MPIGKLFYLFGATQLSVVTNCSLLYLLENGLGLHNIGMLTEGDLAILCETIGERLSMRALIKKLSNEVSVCHSLSFFITQLMFIPVLC